MNENKKQAKNKEKLLLGKDSTKNFIRHS